MACHYRGVTVVLNDGNGKFTDGGVGIAFPATNRESVPFSSRAILATDWNGDGLIDIAAECRDGEDAGGDGDPRHPGA